jgi:hypothetical protein
MDPLDEIGEHREYRPDRTPNRFTVLQKVSCEQVEQYLQCEREARE